MSDEARDLRTKQLSRATERLREALAEVEATPLALDAAIQRFEFSDRLVDLARLLSERLVSTKT